MANYDEKYGLMFEGQANQTWGLSLHIAGKVPLTTNTIFDTYEHMMDYINNPVSSAIQGLTLSVVEDGEKNGLYFVKAIGTKGEDGAALNNGEVVKMSTSIESTGGAAEVQENLDKAVSALTAVDNALSGAISANTSEIATVAQNLNAAIDEFRSADNEINSAITDINTAIVDINSAITDANAAIAENAAAIEAIEEAYKIKEVKEGDKVLAVDADGKLSSTLALDYVSSAKTIYLKGVSGETISTIDASDFIKDGMLSGVTIEKKTDDTPTYMVFTFNTDSGAETIKLDVEEFLNADQINNLEQALKLHKEDMVSHITTEEHAKLTNLYDKSALDTKFNEINSALTANTAAHTQLATDIATLDAKVEAFSGEVNTFKSEVEAFSGEVNTFKSEVSAYTETVAEKFNEIESAITANEEANTAAHEALQANIDSANTRIDETNAYIADVEEDLAALRGEVETLSATVETLSAQVIENEKVTAAALVELQANKVSSIVSTNQSIAITETKTEDGISYDIDLQWNEF